MMITKYIFFVTDDNIIFITYFFNCTIYRFVRENDLSDQVFFHLKQLQLFDDWGPHIMTFMKQLSTLTNRKMN